MESEKRVAYWPGVVLVGLITLCSVFTIALALALLNDVRVAIPDNSRITSDTPGEYNCGPARILMVGEPTDERMEFRAIMDKEPYDPEGVALCRAAWQDVSPGVALVGSSTLLLFLISGVMFTVQVRRGPEPPVASKRAPAVRA